MTSSVSQLVKQSFRGFSIALSMLAVAATLFLPVTHAVGMDAEGPGSISISCVGPDMDHHDDPNGFAGGHCDLQSCSYCFPVPALNQQNLAQVAELKYGWFGNSIQLHRHSPLQRPPRLS